MYNVKLFYLTLVPHPSPTPTPTPTHYKFGGACSP